MSTTLSKNLAATIRGEPPPVESVRLHALNTRVPYGLLASIDVMCQRSGKSRNAICNELLSIGVAEVLSHFDSEHSADFQTARDDLIHGYMSEDEHHSDLEKWGAL